MVIESLLLTRHDPLTREIRLRHTGSKMRAILKLITGAGPLANAKDVYNDTKPIQEVNYMF